MSTSRDHRFNADGSPIRIDRVAGAAAPSPSTSEIFPLRRRLGPADEENMLSTAHNRRMHPHEPAVESSARAGFLRRHRVEVRQ